MADAQVNHLDTLDLLSKATNIIAAAKEANDLAVRAMQSFRAFVQQNLAGKFSHPDSKGNLRICSVPWGRAGSWQIDLSERVDSPPFKELYFTWRGPGRDFDEETYLLPTAWLIDPYAWLAEQFTPAQERAEHEHQARIRARRQDVAELEGRLRQAKEALELETMKEN